MINENNICSEISSKYKTCLIPESQFEAYDTMCKVCLLKSADW